MTLVSHHTLLVVVVSFLSYCFSRYALMSFAFLFCQYSKSALGFPLWPFISSLSRNIVIGKRIHWRSQLGPTWEAAVRCFGVCTLFQNQQQAERDRVWCLQFSNCLVCSAEAGCAVQSQEAVGPAEGLAWLSIYMERKEPDAIIKAEAEFSELTAGVYFVCKISKFAAEITGTHCLV